MAARKRKRSNRKTPSRIRFLAWGLIFLLVIGIAGLKFLQSPRGSVFLLGCGFSSHYARAQGHIQEHLMRAIKDLGLAKSTKITRKAIRLEGKRYLIVELNVKCHEPCDFVKINLALTKAARKSGARVITSREDARGDRLVLEIGKRKFLTHRIILEKAPRETVLKPEKPPAAAPRLALVIDDFGYEKNGTAQAILSLDLPLTISIIPSLRYSRYMLSMVAEAGKEAILHLPMEPEGGYKSDVPMVMTNMSDEEIERMVSGYISDMTGIIGVNNHMGSKATQDVRVMKAVLSVIKERKLFFLDSLTSPRSIAYNTAKQMGVRTARNDLFIDAGTKDSSLVEKRLRGLIKLAESRGFAVGIGHPKKWTLEALRSCESDLKNSGVQLVFLSELVN